MDVPETLRTVEDGNVARLFEATADRRGKSVAIEMGGREFTYESLDERTAAFAGGLHERGFDPGDRLLLYLSNCPEYIVVLLGAFRAGVVVSPVNPQYKARELAHQLEDTNARIAVTHPALRDELAKACAETDHDPTIVTVGGCDNENENVPFADLTGEPTLINRELDDVAMQPYTSGTTGRPKGVHITHRNLRAQAFSGVTFTENPPDEQRALAVLPLYHITGFVHSTWQSLIRGGTVHLRNPGEWNAEEAMRTIEEFGIRSFVGVAAMFVDMVNDESFGDHDLTSLDTINEGGAKMPVAVQERFEETAGVEMSEGYGLTETTAATHTNVGSTFGPKPGNIGQPLRITDCKIVGPDGEELPPGAEGELLVRGPQVMAGYHNRPDATAEAFTDDGYLRTGDIARRDGENYYEIRDRKKHMINTAGYNVYPSEVEELLFEHPAVADAAVVGIPDERRNETVKAFVVPAPNVGSNAAVDATPDDIREFCLSNLAEYKHPREVEFVDELPRTASGKVQKFKLVESGE